jgi:hypothetical protein
MIAAIVTAAAVILSAPFIGQIRAAVRATFPGRFVVIVGGAVALAIAVAVSIALIRIRSQRATRYGAIAAALALGAAYVAWFRTGIPEVDVVERVHFVEYGIITLLFYRAWRLRGDASVLILPILAGLIAGTLEEWFQWFLPVRVGEARDVVLNLVAIGCGLLFSLGLDPPPALTLRLRPGSAVRIRALGAAFVLVFALFFHAVHLGVEVRADGVGTFKSRYDGSELVELARDRTQRWQTAPPQILRRLSQEDQYMDEALWHARRRNDAWAAGDHHTAWRENQILERFFAPVLDTPSYVSATGHRWPSDQRRDAERRAGDSARPYESNAEPRRLFIWSKVVYWTFVLAATFVLIGSGRLTLSRRRAP